MSLAIYLVRHEDADDAEIDSHRALSGIGRRRMRATARLFCDLPDRIDGIWTSPLVRAVQTAEILAQEIGLDEPIEALPEIASPPSIGVLLRMISEAPANLKGLAVVGHEPTLGLLASQILEPPVQVQMRKGSLLAIDFNRKKRKGTFRYVITGDGPELLRDLSQY